MSIMGFILTIIVVCFCISSLMLSGVVAVVILIVVSLFTMMNMTIKHTEKIGDGVSIEIEDDSQSELEVRVRNHQRENDMKRVVTAVTQYQANNNSKIPHQLTPVITPEEFVQLYLHGDFVDPDGEEYNLVWLTRGDDVDVARDDTYRGSSYVENSLTHNVYVYNYATCMDDKVVTTGRARDYAVQYRMEDDEVYCRDSGGELVESM